MNEYDRVKLELWQKAYLQAIPLLAGDKFSLKDCKQIADTAVKDFKESWIQQVTKANVF